MSIEALAMAGVNYAECGINLEPSDELELQPPPLYLVAEEKHLSFQDNKKAADVNKLLIHDELVKEWIREWAKAVASINCTYILTPNQSEIVNDAKALEIVPRKEALEASMTSLIFFFFFWLKP
ncbi:Uncharacterized protein Adt_24376 [Abeliophyllum distichum]|uniref:Uncharacterized protein n=1 Tax=Abeliophyllum distichum TaxID=126358 RepID=A0ABD1SE92_9LAMI